MYPVAYLLFILRGIALYFGARTFITVINGFGAYTATSMTTIRKVVTVLLSFILISKPFTSKYVYGLLLFIGGLYFGLKKKPVPKTNTNNPVNNPPSPPSSPPSPRDTQIEVTPLIHNSNNNNGGQQTV